MGNFDWNNCEERVNIFLSWAGNFCGTLIYQICKNTNSQKLKFVQFIQPWYIIQPWYNMHCHIITPTSLKSNQFYKRFLLNDFYNKINYVNWYHECSSQFLKVIYLNGQQCILQWSIHYILIKIIIKKSLCKAAENGTLQVQLTGLAIFLIFFKEI